MNTKHTIGLVTVASAALAAALLASPASAAPLSADVVSPSISHAVDDATNALSVTLLLNDDRTGFELTGTGTDGATIQLLDSAGAVVQSTVAIDGWWGLPGGRLDGFGGSITIQQLVDGVVTDSKTIDLPTIPLEPVLP
ncbi:hypothetical protein ACO0E1_05835 [Curtobacterium sp. RRHDQ66]|uniref:hypothetical protein n=1 Tax=Curtobacterium guangdongense TaxID=3413380 RepID=UPI003BF4474E